MSAADPWASATRAWANVGAALLGDVALEGAACAGTGVEFVDVTETHAAHVIRSHCFHCPVVGRCRETGDALAPHAVASIYGARFYSAREPVDGWPEVAS